jgi:hypothetical protein
MGMARCARKRLIIESLLIDLYLVTVAVFLIISIINKKKWKLSPIYPIMA